MGVYMAAPTVINPPTATPRAYGLFSAATVIDGDGLWLHCVTYLADGCTHPQTWHDPCTTTTVPNTDIKTVDGGGTLVESCPFWVYDGITCKRVALNDGPDRARNRLALSAQRQVEAEWWESDFLANAQILPGTYENLYDAVGALEASFAAVYGGVGIVHAPAKLGTTFTHDMIVCNCGPQVPRTLLGNAISLGAGYDPAIGPGGLPAEPGTAWIYITGPVVVYRGTPFIPGNEGGWFNRTTNDYTVIAEQPFLFTTDPCAVFAANVQVDCCVPAATALTCMFDVDAAGAAVLTWSPAIPVSVSWGDGPAEAFTVPQAHHQYTSAGSYAVSVTDPSGALAPCVSQLIVEPAPISCVPNLITVDGRDVLLTWINPAGTDVIVEWGDASAPQLLTVTPAMHTYAAAGLYVITVTDAGDPGRRCTSQINIT